MNNILKQALGALTLALLLASCKVTQPYERPAVRTQGLYRDVATADTASLADTPWNRLFPDTLLQRLIAEGIANNLDLKTAMTRIQAAEANLAQSKSAFLPSVTGNGATSDRQSTKRTQRGDRLRLPPVPALCKLQLGGGYLGKTPEYEAFVCSVAAAKRVVPPGRADPAHCQYCQCILLPAGL